MRIISLVPSITEALFDFGLTEREIVGRTKFCTHPENSVGKVAVIGGTKNLNLEKIRQINPDLIIANKEENVKEQIEELQLDFEAIVTDVSTLEENENLLKTLGRLLNKAQTAENFNNKIREVFQNFQDQNRKSCAYLIWKNPYMTVGGDTFISEILGLIGFENIFKNEKRYPLVSVKDLEKAEYIFLSSEPFPFKEKHVEELQKQLPNSKIMLVDGESFSWYGTRLTRCGDYFQYLRVNCP